MKIKIIRFVDKNQIANYFSPLICSGLSKVENFGKNIDSFFPVYFMMS
jgi:hypothetical protein